MTSANYWGKGVPSEQVEIPKFDLEKGGHGRYMFITPQKGEGEVEGSEMRLNLFRLEMKLHLHRLRTNIQRWLRPLEGAEQVTQILS